MNKFDWASMNLVGPAVLPAAARSGNYTGPGVDCLNSDGQMGVFLVGTNTASVVVSVEESDDDGSTDAYAAVGAPATFADIDGQAPLTIAIQATFTAYMINFTRSKRYVRVVLTGTGHLLAGGIIGHRKYLG